MTKKKVAKETDKLKKAAEPEPKKAPKPEVGVKPAPPVVDSSDPILLVKVVGPYEIKGSVVPKPQIDPPFPEVFIGQEGSGRVETGSPVMLRAQGELKRFKGFTGPGVPHGPHGFRVTVSSNITVVATFE